MDKLEQAYVEYVIREGVRVGESIIVNDFSVSYNTFLKIIRGLPVRASLLRRIRERLNDVIQTPEFSDWPARSW